MKGFVGAEHAFRDEEYVRGWANRFVPTAPRLELFDMILAQITREHLAGAHVLELGIGPGYMARHILERSPTISYEGLDFSEAFFRVAEETVGGLRHRLTLTKADLLSPDWPSRLKRPPGAIISTWALHDLGSQQAVADVYARCHATLKEGGVLVNGDFIKPDGTAWDYEPGRFEIAGHLALLRQAGFAAPRCLAVLEHNVEDPTAAQNYACFVAER
jgi:SAM-dependent methyltransferase